LSHDLYSSTNTYKIKTKIGASCDTYGENREAYRVLVGKPEGKHTLEDLGVDGKTILKLILKKKVGTA
jgi:hypothetical protein